MANITVWYLLIDTSKSLIGKADASKVEVDDVWSLKRAVKDFEQMQGIPASKLTVWQCKSPRLLADVDPWELGKSFENVNFSDKDNVFCVASPKRLVDLGLVENEILLVEVPCASSLYLVPFFTRILVIDLEPEPEYIGVAKKSLLSKIAPSQLNSEYQSLQNQPSQKILDDRPHPDVDVPPLPLLYGGFGRFYDYITYEKGRKFDADLKTLVDRFADNICHTGLEEEKRTSVQALLVQIFSPLERKSFQTIIEVKAGIFSGHLIGAHGGPVLLIEFKREPSQAEPQMAGYFNRLALMTRSKVASGWHQPCLGVIIQGALISFHGLIMLESQVRSLPITPTFPCNDSALQSRAPLYAAFMAARTLVSDIEHDAKRHVNSPPRPIPLKSRRFPAVEGLLRVPSSDEQESGRLKFQIKESLSGNRIGRFVYVAVTRGLNPKTILVKFTRKYGKALHEFCAAEKFAPKLLAYEKLAGDWIGVAMEFFASACYFPDSEYLQECGKQWLAEMDNMVSQIHDRGFVHGDLRLPNFIVNEKKLLLVDFDWGDKEGEATFPDVELFPTLRNGRGDVTITKEHDIRVLKDTKKELETCLHDLVMNNRVMDTELVE